MANFRSNRFGSVYIQPTPSEVGLKDTYTQAGHNLQPGTPVYLDSSGNLVAAIATNSTRSTVLGIVESINGNDVTIVYQGEITFPTGATSSSTKFPLVTGNTYYLSASITGGITGGYDTTISTIIKPLLIPTSGYHGVVINSLPLASAPFVTLFTPVGSIVPYVGGGSKLPAGWLLCVGDALPKASTNPPYNDLYTIIGEKYGVNAITRTATTGLTAYVQFDTAIDDPPSEGPGSTKNHYVEANDVFKMVWGSNQSVVQAYSATGTTNNVTFKFLASITGSTSFNSLGVGTEITLKSLIAGEAAGYTSDKFFIPDLRGRMALGAGTGRGLTKRTLGDLGGEETHLLSGSEIPSHSHSIPLLNSAGISGSASYLLNGSTGGTLQATLSSYPQAISPTTSATGGANAHENMPPFMATNWIIRYRSNAGMAGIEVGPRGANGVTGSTGAQGPTGSKGATGATGVGLGALHYAYTSVPKVPVGYMSQYTTVTNDLVLSSKEYYGVGVGDYITAAMSNTNSQRQAIALIRSVRNPSAYSAVLSLKGPYTVVNATGPNSTVTPGTDTAPPVASFVAGETLTYYKLPIRQTLASMGTFVEGEMYSVLLIPSASDGVKGATGATGARGATGANGVNTGVLTYYYEGDAALDRAGNEGYLGWFGAGFWQFASKDYYGVDTADLLKKVGSENITLDSNGNQVARQEKAVQMTIRSLSDNSYVGQFYLNGKYTYSAPSLGVTGFSMATGRIGSGSIAEGWEGGLISGQLYAVQLTPLPIKTTAAIQRYDSTTIYTTAGGGDVPDLSTGSDGGVVADQGSTVDKTQPYGGSTDPNNPTSSEYLFSAMRGTYTKKTAPETDPVYAAATIKNSFIYSMSLTALPCGGNCKGASGYISLCDTVRNVTVDNYFVPPKETNIALVKNAANTVFQSDVTQVVDGCKVNVFGYTGSYFTKIPVGISANYLNPTLGNTGRNVLAIDIYMNVNNIVAGNYIGIRPEYFSLPLIASATGHQSLAGVYKVDSVTGNSVRVYTGVPFGASGANIFTGYITGGITGNFNQVDVYTVSVNFRDCSGYLVKSGELSLGLSAYGLPFVVSFEGATNTSEMAKAVMALDQGTVTIGENMAFYGWPAYGAALYADGGDINAFAPIISKNGVGAYARNSGAILMENPILSANTYAMFSHNGAVINVKGKLTNPRISTAINNAVIGLMNDSIMKVEDSRANLITNRYQAGFYFAGSSDLTVRGGDDMLGLTGATGLCNYCVGSTGGPTGPTGGTAGNAFLIGAPDSNGRATILFGVGTIAVGATGSMTLKAGSPNANQIVVATNSRTPSRAFPDLGTSPPPTASAA
jgi:microcystin-dependent protein